MKFSVITPVYNAASTLERTILSVLSQNLEVELEYIIVDGGSTDGSLEIINQYRDRITKIISEADHGVYDAMNKGIMLTSGDVIGIINADDWYNDNALSTVEGVFQEHLDVSIVYANIDNYVNNQYFHTFIPGKLENLFFKFTLNHPSCFVRRQIYEQVGLFDLNYSIAADYDFMLRAYRADAKFSYVKESLASYSLDGMSGKASNRLRLIQESWRVGYNAASELSMSLQAQRLGFYLNWILKEVLTFPIKKVVNPHKLQNLKRRLRKSLGILPSDKFGTW
jgi:glycosyltransferase involved in cell wall biosynthesis